jgi:tetratricopeptide (TPR) repeat protein
MASKMAKGACQRQRGGLGLRARQNGGFVMSNRFQLVAAVCIVALGLLGISSVVFLRHLVMAETKSAQQSKRNESDVAPKAVIAPIVKAAARPAALAVKEPVDADGFYERGKTRWRDGHLDAALDDLNAAIDLNPKHAGAYLIRFAVFVEREKWDDADDNWEKALELDENCVESFGGKDDKSRLSPLMTAARTHRQKEEDELRTELALLDEGEHLYALIIIRDLKNRNYRHLDEEEFRGRCIGDFIFLHWSVFKNSVLRKQITKWADATGVNEFVGNLGLENNLKQIKITFALLDNIEPQLIRDPLGGWRRVPENRRPEKRIAIRISKDMKRIGFASLPQEDRDFIGRHRILFEEALKKTNR